MSGLGWKVFVSLTSRLGPNIKMLYIIVEHTLYRQSLMTIPKKKNLIKKTEGQECVQAGTNYILTSHWNLE